MVSLAVAARVSFALQPPPGPLSAAWVAEAKDGLVQMLREHRPMDRQGSSVFSLLAANAPDFPEDPDWWRRQFVLRTSGGLGEA